MQDCFVFPCYGLIKTLAGLMDAQDGYVEIYKIDYCPHSGIPTLNVITSDQVDQLMLKDIFDKYQVLQVDTAKCSK